MSYKKDSSSKIPPAKKESKGPLCIRLRTGEELEVKEISISGYINSRMGAVIFGVAPSRGVVGKFCLGVEYIDGESGLIAQEEILEIVDSAGNSLPYGSAKYPGHPDFDPRDGFDPIQNQIDLLHNSMMMKEKRIKRIEKEGLGAVPEEEMGRYKKFWEKRNEKEDVVKEVKSGKKKSKKKNQKKKKKRKDKKKKD